MDAIDSTALVTVQAYRNISDDPVKRSTLIHDETSVQFLAYVLGDKNSEVVRLALETLQRLSDTPRHRKKLASVFGVLESLQLVADKADEFGEELATMAADIFTALKFSRNTAYGNNTQKTSSNNEREPPRTEQIDSDEGLFGALDSSPSGGQSHRFLKYNGKAKIVTVQIGGLVSKEDREVLERQLVRTRGVISIVFDISGSRVTLRVRPDLSLDTIGAAVRKTQTMKAYLVTTDESGEEVLKPIGDAKLDNQGKDEESNLPDYLPEEEPILEASDKAVAPHGLKETASSWLTSAASFLQRSFYW